MNVVAGHTQNYWDLITVGMFLGGICVFWMGVLLMRLVMAAVVGVMLTIVAAPFVLIAGVGYYIITWTKFIWMPLFGMMVYGATLFVKILAVLTLMAGALWITGHGYLVPAAFHRIF